MINIDDSVQLNKIYQETKIKQILINFLYSKVKLSNFTYKQLSHKKDLELITSPEYVFMPYYNGIQSLLVFMRNKDRFYSFIIDKQTLPINKDNIILDNIKIYPISLHLTYKIYEGSIYEGITYIHNNKPMMFIINDVFYFQGEPKYNDLMKYKLLQMDIYLKKYTNNTDTFKLYINDYYTLDEIDKSINIINSKKKINDTNYILFSNGIILYPNISSHRLVYNKNNNMFINKLFNTPVKEKIISNKHKILQDYVPKDIYKQIQLTFLMKKTQEVDNYELFLLTDKLQTSTNKEAYKTISVGFAYIPTTEQSLYWHNIFLNEVSKLVVCKYITTKNLWSPCVIADKNIKLPDFIQKYFEYFDKK